MNKVRSWQLGPRFGNGHVLASEWNGSNWVQKGDTISDTSPTFRRFSVKMCGLGNSFVFGEWELFIREGQVSVHTWNGNSWVQSGATLTGETSSSQHLSVFVGINSDGSKICIGADEYCTNWGQEGGGYVYE